MFNFDHFFSRKKKLMWFITFNPLNIYIYIYICIIHTYIHTFIHSYIYIYIYICINPCPSRLEQQDTPTAACREVGLPNECPDYDTKQSGGEPPVMQDLYCHRSQVRSGSEFKHLIGLNWTKLSYAKLNYLKLNYLDI